jgi:hypothetical protein
MPSLEPETMRQSRPGLLPTLVSKETCHLARLLTSLNPKRHRSSFTPSYCAHYRRVGWHRRRPCA